MELILLENECVPIVGLKWFCVDDWHWGVFLWACHHLLVFCRCFWCWVGWSGSNGGFLQAKWTPCLPLPSWIIFSYLSDSGGSWGIHILFSWIDPMATRPPEIYIFPHGEGPFFWHHIPICPNFFEVGLSNEVPENTCFWYIPLILEDHLHVILAAGCILKHRVNLWLWVWGIWSSDMPGLSNIPSLQ